MLCKNIEFVWDNTTASPQKTSRGLNRESNFTFLLSCGAWKPTFPLTSTFYYRRESFFFLLHFMSFSAFQSKTTFLFFFYPPPPPTKSMAIWVWSPPTILFLEGGITIMTCVSHTCVFEAHAAKEKERKKALFMHCTILLIVRTGAEPISLNTMLKRYFLSCSSLICMLQPVARCNFAL